MIAPDVSAAFAARAVADPTVSVIVPVFNGWRVTEQCLTWLARCDTHVPLQTIVVDDGSTDETVAALAGIPGIDVVRNGSNEGFIGACNRGAALARGRYIYFLNNDTMVQPDAIASLVRRIDGDASIGIVGSKLIYPDGVLQEAGGIVFRDASGWNYGRGASAELAEFNFVRDVDYVSGASLLVRAELFREIGGFDTRFAPAYYEDTDLCFATRERGLRVVCEPRSVVVHLDGATSGQDTSSGVKKHQVRNRPRFRDKWHRTLVRDHYAPSPSNVVAASDRGRYEGTLLVIDSYVPMHDKESGSLRLFRLLGGFRAANWRLIFLPDNFAALQPYCAELQDMGIHVLYHAESDGRTWQQQLMPLLGTIDVAWICRPSLCARYLPFLRANSRVSIAYDTIDLHFTRLRGEAEVTGVPNDDWRKMERLELAAAAAADGTVVVTEQEKAILEERFIESVAVVSNIHDIVREPRAFAATSGIVFIGGYNHTPNVDAVNWLIGYVMPLVWKELPALHVTLLGANPPEAVSDLATERVTVTGYVRDVESYFLRARVCVAPLRFGAGIKGKIGHSLSYALPTVTTSVGAEGFGLRDGVNALIADDTDGFAAAIVALATDQSLWTRIASNSGAVLAPFASDRVCGDAVRFVRSLVGARDKRPAFTDAEMAAVV